MSEDLDRFIRIREVVATCGISRARIYELIGARAFPAPVRFGRTAVWSSNEVQRWLSRQLASRPGGSPEEEEHHVS